MASAPERPVHLDRPRGVLKFDAKRLSEDLMVPLRRQWKACQGQVFNLCHPNNLLQGGNMTHDFFDQSGKPYAYSDDGIAGGVAQNFSEGLNMTDKTYLTRLPFPDGDGTSRFCVAGQMTNDADADFKWTVDSPAGKVAPTYCVDCMGELGAAEQVYGPGALKCMQCGSVFLLHNL